MAFILSQSVQPRERLSVVILPVKPVEDGSIYFLEGEIYPNK